MRKFVNTVLAGALGLSMIAGVTAQDSLETSDPGEAVVDVLVNPGGQLSVVIGNADFGEVQYSSTLEDQRKTADIVVTVTDSYGLNAGWNVTLSGTAFTAEGSSTPFGVNNLVLSTGEVSGDAEDGDGGTISYPTNGIITTGGPVGTAPTNIITASLGSGTGQFTVTFPSSLTIPGGTVVGGYQSTLTVTLTGTAPGDEE